MAIGRLPAWCGGGRAAATRVKTKKQRVKLAGYSSFPSKTPTAQPAAKIVKSAGGGGCSVNGSGALMVELGVGAGDKLDGGGGRRVMVVADGRRRAEAADALQWALAQAVRSNDTVVLLAVVKPAAGDAGDSCVKISRTRCYQHLDAMRKLCESTRPEVKVETCAVQAEERAPAVVEAARQHGVSLLVLAQRRRRAVTRWLLLQTLWLRRWGRRRRQRGGGGGSTTTTVEYCIEHAPCVALGVRRRSSGGYLLSSKRHKDFWLLA
ncbi:hypothetical protein ACP4OV_007589 [Aristida adscensionis]